MQPLVRAVHPRCASVSPLMCTSPASVIDVARQLKSEDLINRLTELSACREIPDFICSDNERSSRHELIREWLDGEVFDTQLEAMALIEGWNKESTMPDRKAHWAIAYRRRTPRRAGLIPAATSTPRSRIVLIARSEALPGSSDAHPDLLGSVEHRQSTLSLQRQKTRSGYAVRFRRYAQDLIRLPDRW